MDDLSITATDSGHASLAIGGKSIRLSGADVGRIVVALLDVAKGLGDPRTVPAEGKPIDWLHVRPTTITIGSSPDAGCEALVLGFGPALVGVSLKRKHMEQIGQAMIAASAGGTPAH